MDYPEWFFAWMSDTPYITMICGWSKKDVIQTVERENEKTWKQIYNRGGRIVKVKISICNKQKKLKNGKLSKTII